MDFFKYCCDLDVELFRMMLCKFLDLSVEEENEKVFFKLQYSWFSEEFLWVDLEIFNLVGGGGG